MRRKGDRRKRQLPPEEYIENRNPPASFGNSADGNDVMRSQADGIVIPETEADCVCLKVEPGHFRSFKNRSWIFTFAIAYPEKYSEHNLIMYATDTSARGSKLVHAAWIATDKQYDPRQPIRKSMFEGKMFRV